MSQPLGRRQPAPSTRRLHAVNDTPAPAQADAARMDGPVIAILDDEPAIRDSLATLLRISGRPVATFADAAAFLAWRRRGEAAVLILDVKLGPGSDGVTLLEQLRSAGDTLPVIIVSGQADMPAVVRALRAGAIDVLEKPYSLKALLGALERALQPLEASACAHRLAALLAPREAAVLARLAEGQGCAAIARETGVPTRQVEVDRAAILGKLGVDSLAQALRIAISARGCGSEPAACPGPLARQ